MDLRHPGGYRKLCQCVSRLSSPRPMFLGTLQGQDVSGRSGMVAAGSCRCRYVPEALAFALEPWLTKGAGTVEARNEMLGLQGFRAVSGEGGACPRVCGDQVHTGPQVSVFR